MAFLPISNVAKNKKFSDSPKFGTVVSNDDPLKLGRVKVKITGIFEGEPNALPWVRRKVDTLFCGSDCEIFDVPEVGSIVEVRWPYDESTPIYSGAPYNKVHQTSTFTNNYPYEAGIKFGPHMIKFDKASQLMTIENSKVQVTLDIMGGLSIACDELIANVKKDIRVNCQNMLVTGDLKVNGKLSSSHGASGTITPIHMAVIDGGVVESIKGAMS